MNVCVCEREREKESDDSTDIIHKIGIKIAFIIVLIRSRLK